MTVHQAAKWLTSKGYRCSSGTVRAMVKAEKIGHFRVGLGVGRIEIAETHLEAFLADQYQGPNSARPKASRLTTMPRSARPDPVSVPMREDWRKLLAREKGA